MDINLIGVPISYGCDRDGTQYGPSKLREYGLIDKIKVVKEDIFDIGNLYVAQVDESEKYKSNKNIKYYDIIYDVNKNLADIVYRSLENGQLPIIIGGDHCIGLGSISGASKYFNNLGVVWIDAHGDFNTDEISESKNAHGMPLAFLCGYGNEELVNLYYKGAKVKEDNVFHIGARDIDVDEEKLLNSTNINIYSKEKIDKIGSIKIVEEISQKCKEQNIDAIHISLDIDFMDEHLVPGTGTRVKGGYSVEDTKFILERFISTGIVKSIDFVEFNPVLDIDNQTLDICIDLLEYIVKIFKNNEQYK